MRILADQTRAWANRVLALLAICALLTGFGWFIWPTPYRMLVARTPSLRTSQLSVIAVRENRLTGKVQILIWPSGVWASAPVVVTTDAVPGSIDPGGRVVDSARSDGAQSARNGIGDLRALRREVNALPQLLVTPPHGTAAQHR